MLGFGCWGSQFNKAQHYQDTSTYYLDRYLDISSGSVRPMLIGYKPVQDRHFEIEMVSQKASQLVEEGRSAQGIVRDRRTTVRGLASAHYMEQSPRLARRPPLRVLLLTLTDRALQKRQRASEGSPRDNATESDRNSIGNPHSSHENQDSGM